MISKLACIGLNITLIFGILQLSSLNLSAGLNNNLDEGKHSFQGVTRCKMCHKKEKRGMQFEIWSGSAHSKTFELLGTPEALEIGKKLGVSIPQEDAKCLRCHTVGHDAPAELRGKKFDLTEGVGCEACHGAGGDYYKSRVMKRIRAGFIEASSVGLIIPDESTCRKCHNSESPTPKEFNYNEMWAKIAHPIP